MMLRGRASGITSKSHNTGSVEQFVCLEHLFVFHLLRLSLEIPFSRADVKYFTDFLAMIEKKTLPMAACLQFP